MKNIDSRFLVIINGQIVFVLLHDYCDYAGAVQAIRELGFSMSDVRESFNYGRLGK